MNIKTQVDKLLANLPHGARVIIKQGWFWNTLAFIVKCITFGKNSNFGKQYTTTIGRTIAMPISVWDTRETDPFTFYWILNHELTHVKQVYKLGFGNFYLGMFLYVISYLLLPLPFGFAYCRYYFEKEAYVAGFIACVPFIEDQSDILYEMNQEIELVIKQLTSGLYGWTMGFFPLFARNNITKSFTSALESLHVQSS